MAFLILVISLLVFRLVAKRHRYYRDQWLHKWRDSVGGVLGEGSWPTALITALIPALIIGGVELWLSNQLWGILSFLLSLAVVLYCLGRNEEHTGIDQFRELIAKGDFESMWRTAQGISNTHCGSEGCDSTQSAVCEMRGAVALQRFEGWAAIMFWFLVAGLPAVVAYRVIERGCEPGVTNRYTQILHWLDWVPVRLMALCFALTGNFVACFNQLKKAISEPKTPTVQVLSATSYAALVEVGQDDEPSVERVDDQALSQQALKTLDDLDELLGRTELLLVVLAAIYFIF